MNAEEPKPKLFPGRYCIETLECGVWETQDMADNLTDALMLASCLCQTLTENRIRISTPDFEIY